MMIPKTLHTKIIFLNIFLFISFSLFSQQDDIQKAIQQRIETGIEQGGVAIGGIYLYNEDSIEKYYTERQFIPVWSDNKDRQDFIEIINSSFEEGLTPSDYHLDKIMALKEELEKDKNNPDINADLDLLMTDAISLYANHLNYGKVMQSKLRKTWNLAENPMPENLSKEFNMALEDNSLLSLIKTYGPQHFMYKKLKVGLKKYRQIEKDGGWPLIPEGETLKPGMSDERIAVMRKRLTITGDLVNDNPADPLLFDDELEQAVKNFQFRNNLTQDGAVGKNTLAQMNVPVAIRIDQIRINMERARWIMHKLEKDFLVVNIAGYNIRRLTDKEVVYYSPVIVGRPYHQSPIFKGTIQYFVINPTWTVPYSIATKETLPRMLKNPNYLAEHNMIIMDRSGKKLDPSTIDFSKYSRSNFPFTVRQEPGPHNALGQVKFIFPNPYSVYLHDTPGRSLFTREERAFSHGCIRLQKKWELLIGLMNEPDVWNMDKINEILATGKTTTVHLNKPIDILILYWTAGADRKDRIYFDVDVYERDPAVLRELDIPWEYKKVK
jgi:murein L,D-transpeptidase YcbB/YkuD